MLRRLVILVLFLGAASPARAASLQVVPVVVELSAAEPRATLVVKNLGDAPVRLELSPSAWNQTPDGEMRLAPAPEVVVYPPLLQLAPQEERKVRISVTAGFGPREQSYRLFIQELPPAEKPAEKTAIRFLTRVGVPIFLMPARPELRAEITGTAVYAGRLAATLKNTGTTRISPGKAKIEGLDADGKSVFSTSFDFWYVLAGGERVIKAALPAEPCARVRAVVLEVPVGDAFVRARVATPGGACGP
jgi:fimbrial chaperone protein